MKKVKNKIKVSYVYAKNNVNDFKFQKALEMLINEEEFKKICEKNKLLKI